MRLGWKTVGSGAAVAAVVAAAFVGSGERDEEEGGRAIDAEGAVARVRLAFRADGDGFVGRGARYEARVAASGAAELAAEGAGSLRLETASIGRGGEALATEAGSAEARGDGSLAIRHGAAVERLRNTDPGLEQTWTFERRPEGEGDLVVRVRVAGAAYAGEAEGGHRFGDPAGAGGFLYGRATWVDARGERTPVASTVLGDEVVLAVPARAVDASAYPAVLDPVVSPELGTDAPVSSPAAWNQKEAAVAFGGGVYLVVWEDGRENGAEVYGARVALDGTLLDPTGFRISGATQFDGKPAVCFGGSSFFVVWESAYGSWPEWQTADIYGARVSPTGTVLDYPIWITLASGNQANPDVAFNGTDYLVVWDDTRDDPTITANADVYAARVTTAGVLRDASGFAVSRATSNQLKPRIAFDGTSCLVVWRDHRNEPESSGGGSGYYTKGDVYGARVQRRGSGLKLLDASGVAIATGAGAQAEARVAFGGGTYLVAWQDAGRIRAARVSTGGAVLDPSGFAVCTGPGTQLAADVRFDGTHFVVAWMDDRGVDAYGNPTKTVRAGRVTPAGALLEPDGVAVAARPEPSSLSLFPAIASSGSGWLLAYDDWQSFRYSDIYATRLDAALGRLDPAPDRVISLSANNQWDPRVASGGSGYLAVWTDQRGGGNQVFATRLDAQGQALDPAGIQVTALADGGNTPVVGYAPLSGNYLVAWWSPYVRAARVRASDGAVLDTPIDVGDPSSRASAIASDGTDFLVVWWRQTPPEYYYRVYATRVSGATGAVLGSRIDVAVGAFDQSQPAVAFDGTRYLVVWQDRRAGGSSGGQTDIYGTFIATDGTVAAPGGFPISAGTHSEYAPTLAWDGTGYAVAWRDNRGGSAFHVYGARVAPSGAVFDPAGVPLFTDADAWGPKLVHDGTGYLLAFQQNGGARGRHLDGALAPLGAAFDIEMSKSTGTGLSVASVGAGTSAIVYHTFDPAALRSFRARVKLVSR
jgi:hypothetical protein